MADLAELTATPDESAIPGHTLNRLTVKDFGSIEGELESRVMAYAKEIASLAGGEVGIALLKSVVSDLSIGKYAYGAKLYNAYICSDAGIDLAAFLELRHAHPKITRDEAARLLRSEIDSEQKKREGAVLTLAGFPPPEKKSPDLNAGTTSPLDGVPSTNTSEASGGSPSTPLGD